MSADASPRQSRIVLALFSLYIIWGSTYLGMRFAMQSFPPLLMGGVRFLIAGSLLMLVMRWKGAAMPTLLQWRNCGIVGLLLVTAGNGGVAFAQQWVASSLAAVMVASTPLWTALFAGLTGRWPRLPDWFSLALGMAGVVLLNLEGDLRGSPMGAAILLAAPACWALGSIFGAKLDLPKGLMSSAAQMLVGGAGMAFLAFLHGDTFPRSPSLVSVAALLYLILFGSLVAYSAYGYLLRNVRPALATSYAYVNPVVALLLGSTLAHEHIGSSGLAGTVLILTAVALMALFRERRVTGLAPAQALK